ncbi:CsiV family protein [Pseudoalteromonas mariniglutinosa]|uniref:CsiV family protein n=1 Tax=Pseudoalteromonas mariniglutinosa TaxID=206042 RepID=UPI00384D7B51
MLLKKSLIIACCVFSSSVFATRWFEAEVLIFKQRPAPYLQEDFSLKYDQIKTQNSKDLLTPAFIEHARQDCLNGDRRLNTDSLTEQLTANHPHSNVCDDSIDFMASYSMLPVIPYAKVREDTEQIYLLAPEQLQFAQQRQQLDRKGLTPLLHTGWRFPEASKAAADSIKLFAGQRLSTQQNHDQYADLLDLVTANKQAFPVITHTTPSWELTGLMKIYVRHYLYINADFDISKKLANGDYEKARFSQFKRVISGEIHYFDHPRMGMIVQIRRYNH